MAGVWWCRSFGKELDLGEIGHWGDDFTGHTCTDVDNFCRYKVSTVKA